MQEPFKATENTAVTPEKTVRNNGTHSESGAGMWNA